MNEQDYVVTRIYKFDNYILDEEQRLLFNKFKEIVPIGQKSLECLLLLVKNPNRVVKKEEFFDLIWKDSFVEDAVLAVNISNIRKVLGEEKEDQFILTIPKNGYKFVKAIEVTQETKEHIKDIWDFPSYYSVDYPEQIDEEKHPLIKQILTENLPAPSPLPGEIQQTTKPRRRNYAKFIGLVLVLVVLGGLIFWLNRSANSIPKNNQKVSIIIFPLENLTGDENLQYISISIPDTLSNSLGELQNARVVPASISQKYLTKSYNPQEEGKKLKVDYVITGSYRIVENGILVNLQVTDISKENPITQQQQFQSSLTDLIGLHQQIAQFLILQLNLSNSNEELAKIRKLSQTNPAAYENYMRGINATVNAQRELAITYFKKAAELDSNFLSAWDYLGLNYVSQASYGGCGKFCLEKAIECYQKVLQINPQYQRVKLSLAMVYLQTNQIEESMRLTQEVIATSPESKYAEFVLGVIYRYAGELNKSLEVIEKGRKREDSDSPVSQMIIAHLYLGDYQKFLQTIRYTLNSDSGTFYAGLAYFYLNQTEEAKASFEKGFTANPNTLTSKLSRFYFYFIQKKEAEAKRALDEINKIIIEKQITNGEMIYAVAQANSVFKQNKEALEMFDLSVESGFFCYPYFVNDKLMQNVKTNPEFQVIVEKSKSKHEDFLRNHLGK